MVGKIKEAIKKMVSKELDEISASGAAGPYATPFAFGKNGKKNATAGLNDPNDKGGGYKVVGKDSTGTLWEEKSKKKTQ